VGLVFLAGLLDDLVGLRPWQKVLAECAAAESVEECWEALVEAGRDLGFHEVEMHVAGHRLSSQLEEQNGRGSWELRVPLGSEDYILLTREFQSNLQNSVVIPFVETLRASLRAKEFPRVAVAGRG
jgi:hypothetical protein